MAESPEAQTLLKKKARRRLIGAVAFAGLAAVVLPMVMDEEPKQQMQDVQIRIPGQDQLLPSAAPSAARSAPAMRAELPPIERNPHARETPTRSADAEPARLTESVVARPAEKAPEKPAEKKVEKTPEKTSEKTQEKVPKQSVDDAQRAAAILAGKPEATTASASGQYVILIGAFSNAANVKLLEGKIGELGVKTYTEPLESPEGKKTRLRAGPFASREVAEKALERLKRIGVNGVVAARQ